VSRSSQSLQSASSCRGTSRSRQQRVRNHARTVRFRGRSRTVGPTSSSSGRLLRHQAALTGLTDLPFVRAPSFSPAASPRLRRRHSLWPPGRRFPSVPEVDLHVIDRRSCTAVQPISTRLELAHLLEGVPPLVSAFVHRPVSLAGPEPSGSSNSFRRCQGCSHLSQCLPGRAALSFIGLLRQAEGGALSSPLGVMAPRDARSRKVTPFRPSVCDSRTGRFDGSYRGPRRRNDDPADARLRSQGASS
jgi:hypothetical protein